MMKYKIIFIFLILIGGIISCSEWPPYMGKSKDYFDAHKKGILELKRGVEKTDFVEIQDSGLSGPIRFRSSFEQQPEILESEHGRMLRRLLEDAGVRSVVREGETMYFEILPQADSKKRYFISFATSTNIDSRPKICGIEFEKQESGKCSLDLEKNWWLEYKWFPKD